MSTDPLASMATRLQETLALLPEADSEEPLVGDNSDNTLTIEVQPDLDVSVEISRSIVAGEAERAEVRKAVAEAVTALLTMQRKRVGISRELRDGLVSDFDEFTAAGQEHLQSRLGEVEERFEAMQERIRSRSPQHGTEGR